MEQRQIIIKIPDSHIMVERWIRTRTKHLLVLLGRKSIQYNSFQSLTLGFLRTPRIKLFKDDTDVRRSSLSAVVFGVGEAVQEETEGSYRCGKGTVICFFCVGREEAPSLPRQHRASQTGFAASRVPCTKWTHQYYSPQLFWFILYIYTDILSVVPASSLDHVLKCYLHCFIILIVLLLIQCI